MNEIYFVEFALLRRQLTHIIKSNYRSSDFFLLHIFFRSRADFAHNLRHWQYLCVMSELEKQFEKLIFEDGLEVPVDLPL